MAKPIHAPEWVQEYCTVPDDPIGCDPLCGSIARKPRIAEPGDLITCQLCLTQLRSHAQWLHQLMKLGYRIGTVRLRIRRAPKVDPRQLHFGDTRREDDD